MEKISGAPNWVQNLSFCHFLKVASLVFLDIAVNCILGQRLTSSRAETSKKNCDSNEGQNNHHYSNVVECPLKLACFYKQPVYKQLVLRWQVAKQL